MTDAAMAENLSDTVCILLSCYGEAPYLEDFLNSLRRQTAKNWRIFARCDGPVSERAKQLLRDLPELELLPDETHLGVPASYRELLRRAPDCRRYMFADQDDVWLPEKIGVSVTAIREAEADSPGRPILVHSDLRITDVRLAPVAESLAAYQSLDPKRCRLQDLMVQNNVTGCTMIFNRELRELAADIPPEAICHDWYLAMIAAAFGRIAYLPRPLVLYRQHAANVYGAVSRRQFFRHGLSRRELHRKLALTQDQAAGFLRQFRARLSPEQIETLSAWSSLPDQKSYFRRLFSVWRHGFRKNDLVRTFGMWWAL